ncbi:unnamed protein product [Musa hybrid cultivar]
MEHAKNAAFAAIEAEALPMFTSQLLFLLSRRSWKIMMSYWVLISYRSLMRCAQIESGLVTRKDQGPTIAKTAMRTWHRGHTWDTHCFRITSLVSYPQQRLPPPVLSPPPSQAI